MADSPHPEVCQRLAKIRIEIAGPRGKSAFAKMLGLSPSTYAYYESTREPSLRTIVQIAELTDVDLRWLLTGRSSPQPGVPAGHPAVRRAAAVLAKYPNAAKPLAAFLDILSETLKFPQKKPLEAFGGPAESRLAKARWIPVLARTAAGVAQFWSDEDENAGITMLSELVARHARGSGRQVRSALADGDQKGDRTTVQIISLCAPDSNDVVEFVAAGSLKARYPDAFAVRVDGESMTPDIQHGDMVILSPSAPAVDGRAAVVQLKRQIGVTCKLYRRSGNTVHLVPINEQFPPQAYPAGQVTWALRVLAKIRL